MARATRKSTSKRRAAALKFLSNISFETSVVQQQSATDQTVEIKNERRLDSYTHLATEDRIGIMHEFIPSKFIEMDCSKPQSFTPFRERYLKIILLMLKDYENSSHIISFIFQRQYFCYSFYCLLQK